VSSTVRGGQRSGTHGAAAARRAQGVQRSLQKAAVWLRKAALTLDQPRRILAALEHGANASAVDALFPPQLQASPSPLPYHLPLHDLVSALPATRYPL
jgi:hypothetical protein